MGVYDDMRVDDLPVGEVGSLRVERFTVDRNSPFLWRPDSPPAGTYTRLMEGRRLWMSDTPSERRDHMSAAHEMRRRGGRVLIGGLGLGMVVRAGLRSPLVREVDVVELRQEVIDLVGPHYQTMAEENGVELRFHCADMMAVRWPSGTRWDVAWFDIWPDICTDDLAEMTKLRRSYGRRTGWNDCWGRHRLLRHRETERRQRWY